MRLRYVLSGCDWWTCDKEATIYGTALALAQRPNMTSVQLSFMESQSYGINFRELNLLVFHDIHFGNN